MKHREGARWDDDPEPRNISRGFAEASFGKDEVDEFGIFQCLALYLFELITYLLVWILFVFHLFFVCSCNIGRCRVFFIYFEAI